MPWASKLRLHSSLPMNILSKWWHWSHQRNKSLLKWNVPSLCPKSMKGPLSCSDNQPRCCSIWGAPRCFSVFAATLHLPWFVPNGSLMLHHSVLISTLATWLHQSWNFESRGRGCDPGSDIWKSQDSVCNKGEIHTDKLSMSSFFVKNTFWTVRICQWALLHSLPLRIP